MGTKLLVDTPMLNLCLREDQDALRDRVRLKLASCELWPSAHRLSPFARSQCAQLCS